MFGIRNEVCTIHDSFTSVLKISRYIIIYGEKSFLVYFNSVKVFKIRWNFYTIFSTRKRLLQDMLRVARTILVQGNSKAFRYVMLYEEESFATYVIMFSYVNIMKLVLICELH